MMKYMKRVIFVTMILCTVLVASYSQKGKHNFRFDDTEFLLDGKPFRIISGEIHPARIPAEYWQHRIRMAKALGCNTICASIFWNYHETSEGIFDFENGNRNLGQFIRICQEEEMFLILKTGPYTSDSWESGGIPQYLAGNNNVSLRSSDPVFMEAAERFIAEISAFLEPLQVSKGGPVIMIQIENNYGSFGNDRNYLTELKRIWQKNGIEIPAFTSNNATEEALGSGTLPGSAVGLITGGKQENFDMAAKINPGVPVFCSALETGKGSYWGGQWGQSDTLRLLQDVRFLMDKGKSFNLCVIHGGTNFGYTAGANWGEKGYEPHITSYDNDALVTEQGRPGPGYHALREMIGSYLPKGKKMPEIPDAPDAIELTPFFIQPFTSLWDNLPAPVTSIDPVTFDSTGQDHGFILYRTDLTDTTGGILAVHDIHDYATVFLNGIYIGYLDRREGVNTVEIPGHDGGSAVIEILAEAMGRIDPTAKIDKKGITDSVTLNGVRLKNWKIYNLPVDDKYVYNLRSSRTLNKPGIFFRGNFMLTREAGFKRADTYIDLSNFKKGIVWVNGHNIGKYWNIGPQKRLYCPASWLREGLNEVMVLDLHETQMRMITGHKTLK